MTLRLGTRGSRLALVQAEMVRAALAQRGTPAEVVVVSTTGDVRKDAPIADLGGVGAFVKELDEAVRDRRVDAAVHSLKDIPTIGREGLVLAADLPRDAAGDALVGARSLADLPHGARVGTSSLRRRAQLLRARPDLDVRPLRGNVPTRLEKVDRRELDAVLVSRGGLARLGLDGRAVALDPWSFPHAPGQGVVAVVAAEGSATLATLSSLDDADTRLATEVERAIMSTLGGGCLAPLGVYAEAGRLAVDVAAEVLAADGSEAVSARASFPRARALADAEAFARSMKERGGGRLLDASRVS